jgi:hypothetical protein
MKSPSSSFSFDEKTKMIAHFYMNVIRISLRCYEIRLSNGFIANKLILRLSLSLREEGVLDGVRG